MFLGLFFYLLINERNAYMAFYKRRQLCNNTDLDICVRAAYRSAFLFSTPSLSRSGAAVPSILFALRQFCVLIERACAPSSSVRGTKLYHRRRSCFVLIPPLMPLPSYCCNILPLLLPLHKYCGGANEVTSSNLEVLFSKRGAHVVVGIGTSGCGFLHFVA